MEREAEGVAREREAMAMERVRAVGREMKKTKREEVELKLCRRHVRQGPTWMEDPAKAAAMHGIKAALKEDSASCYICVARASVLNRIKAAGGDEIMAAKESESRARGEICIMKRFAPAAWEKAAKEEAKPMKVRGSYIKELLTGCPLTPLPPLSEDYFPLDPEDRETILSSAFELLMRIDEIDNILCQFFEKGYAMMEVKIHYC